MRAASLCSGYGGLDMAAAAVFDLELAWYAEVDPDASKVLAHHYPRVPNHGDITAIDWTQVEPVDLLTAGYPCQPMSFAGRRAGLSDERWLWDDGVFPAIRDLRPGIVLLENVPGHLSVGFGRVLGDLAAVGYDASWMCVRASDVGAPHRRERVFIVAQDADRAASSQWRFAAPGQAQGGRARADAGGRGGASAAGGVSLLPTPTTANSHGNHVNNRGNLLLPGAVALLPTPTVVDARGGRNATSGRTDPDSQHHSGWTLSDVAHADRWGEYATAIARWEYVTGRPAPEPTEPTAKGGRRLAPPFVEWLMGLPEGWVTEVPRLWRDEDGTESIVPALTRNAMLRILGNGVVPQQGAYAISSLLGHVFAEVAA